MSDPKDNTSHLFDAFVEHADPGAELRKTSLGLEITTDTKRLITWDGAADEKGDGVAYVVDRLRLDEELRRMLLTPTPLSILPPGHDERRFAWLLYAYRPPRAPSDP